MKVSRPVSTYTLAVSSATAHVYLGPANYDSQGIAPGRIGTAPLQ